MIRLISTLLLIASVAVGAPNIVLIMVDDVGAEAMWQYGNDITNRTPNIDSIASAGMTLNNFHTYSVCGPSRASIISGRNSELTGITSAPGSGYPLGNPNDITLGHLLQRVGYVNGAFEKWNLADGTGTPAEYSDNIAALGFPSNNCFAGTTIDYWVGSPTSDDTQYYPYIYKESVLEFIRANTNSPFFLWWSPGLCHSPFGPTPDDHTFSGTDTQHFDKMLQYLDGLVGEVVDELDTLGIIDNTVIIFSADNGTDTAITNVVGGVDVPGGKGGQFTTAVKVPMFIQWNGVIATNSTYDGITTAEDLYNTIAEMAGVDIPYDRVVSGVSFYDQLLGASTDHRRYFYQGGSAGMPQNTTTIGYKYQNSNLMKINWPLVDANLALDTPLKTVKHIRLRDYHTNTANIATAYTVWSRPTNENVITSSP